MILYNIVVNSSQLVETDIDTIETYSFVDQSEAEKFYDHLKDLYKLTPEFRIEETVTYDKAIEIFVELFGPSEDD